MQASLSLQQSPHNTHSRTSTDTHTCSINSQEKHCQGIAPFRSIHTVISEVQQAQRSGVLSQSSKPPSPPSFTGGGENFKGWQKKLKGTLFIRAWRETYRGCASALNQPRLLDMLNWRVAEWDRLESQRWRQKQRKML